MIKQIVDFSRNEEERGAATIEVFMLADDPQKHIEAIKSLIKDGAIIQSVDSDTIRAKFKGVTQDKLLELIEDGWAFTQADTSDEAEELKKFVEFDNEVNRKIAKIEAEPDRLTPMIDRLIAESESEGGPGRAGLLEAVEMLNTMLKEHSDEELSTLRHEATGGNDGKDRRAIIEFAAKLEEQLDQYFTGREAVTG